MYNLSKEYGVSKRDRERAKEFIYRSGSKIPAPTEADRLANIGLVKGKAKILTLEEVIKERRPISG